MTLSIVLASYRLVRLIPSVAKSEWPIWVSRCARPDLLTLEGRTDCGSMVGNWEVNFRVARQNEAAGAADAAA